MSELVAVQSFCPNAACPDHGKVAVCVWEDVVYNLTRPVKTLRLELFPQTDSRWLQRSPAMAAGITDHLCTYQLYLGRLPRL
jgi:hypothetical protein